MTEDTIRGRVKAIKEGLRMSYDSFENITVCVVDSEGKQIYREELPLEAGTGLSGKARTAKLTLKKDKEGPVTRVSFIATRASLQIGDQVLDSTSIPNVLGVKAEKLLASTLTALIEEKAPYKVGFVHGLHKEIPCTTTNATTLERAVEEVDKLRAKTYPIYLPNVVLNQQKSSSNALLLSCFTGEEIEELVTIQVGGKSLRIAGTAALLVVGDSGREEVLLAADVVQGMFLRSAFGKMEVLAAKKSTPPTPLASCSIKIAGDNLLIGPVCVLAKPE